MISWYTNGAHFALILPLEQEGIGVYFTRIHTLQGCFQGDLDDWTNDGQETTGHDAYEAHKISHISIYIYIYPYLDRQIGGQRHHPHNRVLGVSMNDLVEHKVDLLNRHLMMVTLPSPSDVRHGNHKENVNSNLWYRADFAGS